MHESYETFIIHEVLIQSPIDDARLGHDNSIPKNLHKTDHCSAS